METLTLTEVARAPAALPLFVAPTATRRAVATLFLVNGVLFSTWVSRIPAIEAGRGLTHATLGLYLFVLALGAMISMPLTGMLISRFGSDRVCRFALLIYAGMLPLLALAPSALTFALALFGFGIGHGSLDIAMNAQAVAVEKAYRRPIMSSFHALWSTGGLTGAALGGGIAALGLTPATHFALMAALLGVVGWTTFRDLLPFEAPGEIADLEKQALFPLPSRGLLALGAIALCIMMGEGAMADWSGLYLRKILTTSEGFAAAGYAAFSIAMAGGRFFGDKLSGHFGPVALVRGSTSFALFGLLLILLAPWSSVTLVGFACVGLGFATIIPQVFSAAGHRSGVDAGTALASVATLGYFGFLLGPPIIGFAAGVVGLHAAMGLLLASTALAVALAGSVRSAT